MNAKKVVLKCTLVLLFLLGVMCVSFSTRTDAAVKKYTVKFVDTLNKNKVISTQVVVKGKAAKAPKAPAHAGYAFKKWSSTAYKKVTKNLTIKTVYEKNVSTLTLVDGVTGKTITTLKVKNGNAVKLPNAPTHAGYTFKSWTGIKNGQILKKAVTKKVTANYTANKYTVKYQPNGGKGSMSDTTATYGKAFTLPACKFTNEFKYFAGWERRSDNKIFAAGTSVSNLATSGSINLYAVWKDTPVKDFTITYNLGGGVNHPDNPTTYNRTDSITLKAPTRQGYTFVGWTGTGLNTTTKTVRISKSEGNRSYTAVWSEREWTIKFNKNGGKGSIDSIKVKTTDTVDIPSSSSNTIWRDNYRFTGWNTKANGSGIDVQPGKIAAILVTPATATGTTVNLYAQWVKE